MKFSSWAVAETLREIRIEKGISQRELSRRLRQVHNFINAVENGKRKLLFDEFLAICELLDADPHEVLDKILVEKKRK
jgi:transcriptional regulator with XRE-family HTH domain